MTSRDFGFITLRNTTAYQPNGMPVPPNYVFVTSTNGSAVFSNNMSLSSLNASTINVRNMNASSILVSTLGASTINVSTLNAEILNASTSIISSLFGENIITNFITVNSTMDASSINTSTLSTTNIFADYGRFSSIQTGNISVSSFTTSSIFTDTLIASSITTEYISTLNHMVLLDNNNSTLIMDSVNSTLYVNGFPVLTEGNISSISSLYWEDTANGNIYNKNIGIAPFYYQVGVGTSTNPLNATLDVVYSGTNPTGNAFNISSYNNTFTINNSNVGPYNFMTAILSNNQDNNNATSIGFEKSKNFNSTLDGSELGYISFYGTDETQLRARGAFILAKQNGIVSTFTPTDLQFITNTSSIDGEIRLIIKSDGNVGINTINPAYTLDVNGSTNITGSLFVGGDITSNGLLCASTLCASTLEMTDGTINGLSTISAVNGVHIVGAQDDSAELSLFNGKTLIGTNSIYDGCFIELDNSGPNFYITDPLASKTYAQFGSTINRLNANTEILASSFYFSSLNHLDASTFQMDFGDANLKIYNSTFSYPSTTFLQNTGGGQLVLGTYSPSLFINGVNSGTGDYIGINTSTPQQRLDVRGSIQTSGNIYLNQGIISSAGSISTNYLTANSSVYTNYGLVNNNLGIRIIDGFGNNTDRPPIVASNTLSSFIIHGTSVSGDGLDDGFLQLSAGGGFNPNVMSYIQLSGYSQKADMDQNIVLGTSGVERMRLSTTGVNISGNLNVSGSAVSRVACSTILSDPSSDGSFWTNFYGLYNFVSSGILSNITLPTSNTPSSGTILVLRNTGATLPIAVTNTVDTTGNTILPGKTSSYTYVTGITSVPNGWYGL